MKRILTILCVLICIPAAAADYKVIKIVDGDTVYLDFNKNGAAEPDERIRLNGIDAFELHMSQHLKQQMQTFGLSEIEVLTLGYLGKEFAKQELLNKKVSAKYSADEINDKYQRHLMSIKYDNNKSYEEEILKAGLATVYKKSNLASNLIKYENSNKILENAKTYPNYNLMYYNFKTKQYYSLTSDEARNSENILLNLHKPTTNN